MAPRVTVLLATYNSAPYLREASTSILKQTWRDFDFVIIDDGSTDDSSDILAELAQQDPRIRIVHQRNQGLANALNRGIDLACGEYIARMDADDESLPKRLETQVNFLDSHPAMGICGTWVKTIGEHSGTVWRYPTHHAEICSYTVFGNPFAHSTIMMRRTFFAEAQLRYNSELRYAQDYDLWTRAIEQMEVANLPQVHLLYRQHAAQAGKARFAAQDAAAAHVRQRQLLCLGISPNDYENELHTAVSTLRCPVSREFIVQVEAWLTRLDHANKRALAFPPDAFSRVVAQQWYRVCSVTAALGSWVFMYFHQSNLTAALDSAWQARLRLGAKSLLIRKETG